MEFLLFLADFILHIDKHLDEITTSYGTLTYAILFLIVFCETGLVVTPFLPGDSLLFAAGTFCARGSLDLTLTCGLIFVAAVIGDAVNYSIGNRIGPRAFQNPNSRIFHQSYKVRTEQFFKRYGGKAIIFARFVPIVRTFAPFLAGVGKMSYPRFALYNVNGAFLWVGLFVVGGFYFSELPIVKKNFTLVVFAIIILSILPAVIEVVRARRQSAAARA